MQSWVPPNYPPSRILKVPPPILTAQIYNILADKLLIYRENFERAYIEATEQFYSVKAPEQLGAGNSENGGQGVYAYMRYAESKLREEEQRAQKYLETSLCTTTVNNSIPVAVGPQHPHQTHQQTSNNSTSGSGSQQPVVTNGGGVVAAGIGTANGLNSTSTSGSVQNLVDSCVVSALVQGRCQGRKAFFVVG